MISFAELLSIPLPELTNRALRPVKVAVLDTGIDASHEVLKGKVIRAFGYRRDESGTIETLNLRKTVNNDPSGHGTGAAAIIGTLAPNARFLDYRVLDADNGGYGSTVVRGLEEAVESDADIINMSVAYRKNRYWEPTAKLLEEAYRRNKIVVAAKRNMPLPDDLGLPAELSNAISVDIGEYSNPYLFKYLEHSPIEFSANGVAVLTAKTGGGYIRMSGTSFATPTIASFCSLLRGINPKLKLFEIKTLLKNWAEPKSQKSFVRFENPLEFAPATNDHRYQQVDYKCPHCGMVSEVSDAFTVVRCQKCGKAGRKPVLMDPRIYFNVLDEIRHEVPCEFHYHNWEHAQDTVEAVYKILKHYPKLPVWRKRSLLMAALLHDYGFSVSRENHEEEGAKLAERISSGCEYSEREIKLISRLILATKKEHRPTTLEEKIIRDADLFHIGTHRQNSVAKRIRQELEEFGQRFSDSEWSRRNNEFVRAHRFNLSWLGKERSVKESA